MDAFSNGNKQHEPESWLIKTEVASMPILHSVCFIQGNFQCK